MSLLERDDTIAELDRLFEHAAGGAGRFVVIAGEAGIGKTTLVDAFARGMAQSAAVLRGACDPLSTPQALGPLHDIAESAASDLGDLLRQAAPRDQIFRAFLTLLSDSSRPVVAIIEDVHWADEATLDLLRFVGRRIADRRSLLLATYRDDEVHHRHQLRVVLGDLATSRAVHRLSLKPLTGAAVRELASGTDINPALLHSLTGGNPFFVTEVLASGTAAVPSSVQDAVLARVARLSPAGRNALEAAAVIGAVLEPWVLDAAAGAGTASIEESTAAGMLRVQADGVLIFRHEIARAAIVGTIPAQRLVLLHRRILATLRAAPPGVIDLARLAHHAEGAGDREAVLEFATASAREAAQLRSHREAASQYARALRFSAGLPPEERADLLERRSYQCYLVDQIEESLAARTAALAIWRSQGQRLKEGESLRWLSRLNWFRGRNEDARRYGLEALAVLEPLAPSAQLAMAYSNLSQLETLSAKHASAIAWGEKAIAMAEQVGDVETQIHALNNVGMARSNLGDERGPRELERSLAMARAAGLEEHVARAFTNLGSIAVARFQHERANRYLSDGLAYCIEHDLDSWRMYKLGWHAVSLLYQGEWPAAGDAAMQVLGHTDVAPVSRLQALVAIGCLRARRGDPEASTVLDEALAVATPTGELQRLGPVWAARAEAAWLAGDLEQGRVEALAGYALATTRKDPWLAGQLAFWVWRCGGLDVAPPYLAEPFRLHIAGDWQGAAACWHDLGCPYEEAQALADSAAAATLRRALDIFEELGARPMAAYVVRRMRDAGVRGIPRGPRPSTKANPADLTRREMDVLRLLAGGLRNAEIAGRLYLAPKTVDHHVSAVLSKLGASTRTEAVSRATALGLISHDAGSVAPESGRGLGH